MALLITVPCPFHYNLCRNTESQCITDECPSSCMCAGNAYFGVTSSIPFISFVVGFTYRFVNFCQFSQFFQIIIHFLIADNRQCHVVFKMDVLVFFKYGFTVLVQFNTQTICRFNGGDFYMVGLDITSL